MYIFIGSEERTLSIQILTVQNSGFEPDCRNFRHN